MSLKIKQSVLVVASLILVAVTLCISMPANNFEQMKKIEFGYPLTFISQDFSYYDQSFSFFPRWQKFSFRDHKKFPLVSFSPLKFLADWAFVLILLEILIYILESLKFWFQNKFTKK